MRKAESQQTTTDSSVCQQVIPLSQLSSGQSAIIDDLLGGRGFISRLVTLGFTPGAVVKMLQNVGRGPLIVLVRDTRIALGRGEAQKILVTVPNRA